MIEVLRKIIYEYLDNDMQYFIYKKEPTFCLSVVAKQIQEPEKLIERLITTGNPYIINYFLLADKKYQLMQGPDILAIRHGRTDALDVLTGLCFNWAYDIALLGTAIQNNKLCAIEWLHKNNKMPSTVQIIANSIWSIAVGNNNFDIIKWAHINGHIHGSDSNLFKHIITMKRYEMAKLFRESTTSTTSTASTERTVNKYIAFSTIENIILCLNCRDQKMLDIFYNLKVFSGMSILDFTAGHGTIEHLEWLLTEDRYDIDVSASGACFYSAVNLKFDNMKWLYDNGFPLDSRVYTCLIMADRPDIVKWCLSKDINPDKDSLFYAKLYNRTLIIDILQAL